MVRRWPQSHYEHVCHLAASPFCGEHQGLVVGGSQGHWAPSVMGVPWLDMSQWRWGRLGRSRPGSQSGGQCGGRRFCPAGKASEGAAPACR